MKLLRQFPSLAQAGLSLLFLAAVLLSGCDTTNSSGKFSNVPGEPPGKVVDREVFQTGDRVAVNLTGITEPPPAHMEAIKDDGTITMPNIGSIQAAGKTPGELQREIFNLYVPRLYTSNLTITVMPQDRYIYIGGEIRSPGRVPYLGDMTVMRVIQTAGDFTPFASKRNVKLTRADGTVIKINANKAINDASKDLSVFPGDKIFVDRRAF